MQRMVCDTSSEPGYLQQWHEFTLPADMGKRSRKRGGQTARHCPLSAPRVVLMGKQNSNRETRRPVEARLRVLDVAVNLEPAVDWLLAGTQSFPGGLRNSFCDCDRSTVSYKTPHANQAFSSNVDIRGFSTSAPGNRFAPSGGFAPTRRTCAADAPARLWRPAAPGDRFPREVQIDVA
jgi:hypothetical protein